MNIKTEVSKTAKQKPLRCAKCGNEDINEFQLRRDLVTIEFHHLFQDKQGMIWAKDDVCNFNHETDVIAVYVECQKCWHRVKRSDIEICYD
jgi:hypothetical protein